MHTKGTYYKSLFLLMVFSLNMIVSMACSLSSYVHSLHHESPATDFHSGQKKTHHHQHEHSKKPHHLHDPKTGLPKDDCCSGSVVLVQQMDKSVTRSIEAPGILSTIVLLPGFVSITDLFTTEEKTKTPPFDRWRQPATITDLRIIIQSFQI
jgi:hypothetical protein